ncbi:receptor tyrosine-protein kinase erbB-4-like [Mercenaria mercenaria]|uniref:receptor tyrosine-protein kinase erbB-4-like n=1 Tax=Mercenaria mercenaria TaxID=6596 RepID=UPI00234EAABB|nr:receptor tyrosine-protein kinase erbB-4-like [Mercenaria mercenaria]
MAWRPCKSALIEMVTIIAIYCTSARGLKVCHGTSEGIVWATNSDSQYAMYKNRYTNCSYVYGNLEITGLEGAYDLGFLKDIEEIDGYLLVANVFSNYLNLTKLRIIRGNKLFPVGKNNYSIYIALNYNPENITQGLLELQFKSLTEIVKGQVYFKNNNLLCFENTITWNDINPYTSPPASFIFDSLTYRRQCPSCPENCFNPANQYRQCWGSSPDMCQQLNFIKKVCSDSCHNRCYGSDQNGCCHSECAAGCSGPLKTDCFACKNFYYDGECYEECPKLKVGADYTYSLGSLCLRDCPVYMLKDKRSCVMKCPVGKCPNESTNVCEQCTHVQKCAGLSASEYLHSENIEGFRDCEIIEGNLKILKVSFYGDPHSGTEVIKPNDLQILKDVKEIIGFLSIQETPSEVKDLSFLSGLETIHGRITSSGNALTILKTEIENLGLISLRHVHNGDVLLGLNARLCFIYDLDMNSILTESTQNFRSIENRDKSKCDALGLVCSSSCSHHGCMGPGIHNCLKCDNTSYSISDDNVCLEGCSNRSLFFISDNGCPKSCHEQCATGCFGPGTDQCFECKQLKLLGEGNEFQCTAQCPLFTYPDVKNVCRQCHVACAAGCTGPSSVVKEGGCNSCLLALKQSHENDSVVCLPRNQTYCPEGYYKQRQIINVTLPPKRIWVCLPCDDQCNLCYGPGNTNCFECRKLRYLNSICVNECPPNSFLQGDECLQCHDQCTEGCHGNSSTDCSDCLNFKIILNDELKSFACVDRCPEYLQDLSKDVDGTSKAVCTNKTTVTGKISGDNTRTFIIEASAIATATVVIFIVVTLSVCLWRRKRKRKRQLSRNETTELMSKGYTFFSTEEPLCPTDAKPDLSKLRIIKESELRRGGVIGSGAFGMVYKGFWVPQGENVKIPVAIKVLREGTISLNQHHELLDESRVMASVEHPSCVRLLAVCMASQRMMMISQLMPLGCLIGYIKKHEDIIGSKTLLNWCAQIARGMVYLEKRGIVHRDLAARNILVQTADQVKITDFGLAKLLDYKKDEVHATGEKVPIRWLAPECIQDRIYSHKSDVWSYGVTLWEMFTYGARPYEKERLRDVPDLIEKGERLPQPAICTIDVYMIMIKCWMYNAERRPSFVELAEEFAKMSRDPGRYLVIQGDKMMKLPAYLDISDYKDLHTDTCAEGPEKLIEADEYFRISLPEPLVEDSHNSASISPADVHIHLDKDGYLQPKSAPPNMYMDLESNEDDKNKKYKTQTTAINDRGNMGLVTMSEPSGCLHPENVPADTIALEDEDMQHKMTSPNQLYLNLENDGDKGKKFRPQTAWINEKEGDMSLETTSEPSGFFHSENILIDTTELEDEDLRRKMTSPSHLYLNMENDDDKDEKMALLNRAIDSRNDDKRSRFEFKNKSRSSFESKHKRASRFESRNTTANRLESKNKAVNTLESRNETMSSFMSKNETERSLETKYETASCFDSTDAIGYCSAPETFLADTTVFKKEVIQQKKTSLSMNLL